MAIVLPPDWVDRARNAVTGQPPATFQRRKPGGSNSYMGGAYEGIARRRPGRDVAAGAASRAREEYAPDAAINELLQSIAADFDAQQAEILNEYGRASSGGGGGSGYGQAIADAEELLADVLNNRGELKTIYDEYDRFIDPLSQEAIDSAAKMVGEGTAALGGVAAREQGDITASFTQAEETVGQFADLIQAGAAAKGVVADDAGEGEALRIAQAIEDAAFAKSNLDLAGTAAKTQAVADRDLNKGSVQREEMKLDLEFQEMEKEVRDELAAARAAAAAASAAAARRRGAMAAERDAALAELNQERYAAMRLNPHEAGEATALTYLRNNASGLDYNRQQLVLSTVGNAISSQVRSNNVGRWARDQGVALSKGELGYVRGAVQAYTAGMRHQQNRDTRTAPRAVRPGGAS